MQNVNILAFNNEPQAFQVRNALIKLEHESLRNTIDAVVATRDATGNVKSHQSAHGAGTFAAGGVVAGMIVGMLRLNPLLGIVVGTASGAAVGALVDLGLGDRFMKNLGATSRRALPPCAARQKEPAR